jgi:UDP-N-acetyl-D-mannosaminuronic acid dehydrogenase
VDAAPEQARLIRTAREVNDSKPHHIVAKIREAASQTAVADDVPVVALLGLAFKADVDDLRESPAVEIALELATGNPSVRVLAVEPHIRALPPALAAAGVELVSLGDALALAPLFVLLVDHKVFKTISREKFTGKTLLDTRGVWHSI